MRGVNAPVATEMEQPLMEVPAPAARPNESRSVFEQYGAPIDFDAPPAAPNPAFSVSGALAAS